MPAPTSKRRIDYDRDDLTIEVRFDSFAEMEALAEWLRQAADEQPSLTVRLAAEKVLEVLA